MPTIEDFLKFEFKVAKIVDAQDHPNADKLLVLKIDVGEIETPIKTENPLSTENLLGAEYIQPRPENNIPKYKQIVAGIKKSYSKEELVGKYIVVVNNLEPAVLRGVESNGMLLAATGSDGMPILISPEKPVEPGSKVK